MRIIFTILAALVLLSLPVLGAAVPGAMAAPAKADGETRWQRLEQEARKEGTLVVYSTTAGDALRGIFSAFQAKYGVRVDFVVGRGGALVTRMKSERAASLYMPDVIMSGGTTLLTSMKPSGLIDSFAGTFILPEVVDNSAWIGGEMPYLDKGLYAVGMLAVLQHYVVRNTDLAKEEEIKSYQDLLDPKWKRQMVLNDPTESGAGSALFSHLAYDVYGLDKTLEYMRQLAKQEPVITKDTGLQVEWVAKGKYAVAVAPMQERVAHFLKAGAPLAHVKMKEGGKIGPGIGGLGLANKRPHPKAAALFVNWLLSKEGMAQIVKAYKYPGTRVDSPRTGVPPMFFPDPGEKVYRDTEEEILNRKKIMAHSKEIFGALMK